MSELLFRIERLIHFYLLNDIICIYKYLVCVCDNKCFAGRLTFFCCFPCLADFYGELQCIHILLTYLLTPCCRVLLEKLTGLQLVKKFPAFHGIRRFITALPSVRHPSLSWASPIQSIYTHPTS